MVKLGAYKNCRKRLKRFGLPDETIDVVCSEYLKDDEWAVRTASKLEKTGFEVEKPAVEETGFELKKPKQRVTKFEVSKPEEVTYRSKPFWKGWTPAGGKGAGRLEPEKRRPTKAVPLSAQLPLFQPWRSIKSEHRLQTKLERIETEEEKYLTQEQLAKRAQYAVSIKKRDSGELEITLPTIILDIDPMKTVKRGDLPPTIQQHLTTPKGQKIETFITGKGGKKIPIVAKGKSEPLKQELDPAGLMGKSIQNIQAIIKTLNRINQSQSRLFSGERGEALRKTALAPLKQKYKLPETEGISGTESVFKGYERLAKMKMAKTTGEAKYQTGPSRIEKYLKGTHTYPENKIEEPRGPEYSAEKTYKNLAEATKEAQPIESLPQSSLIPILTSNPTDLEQLLKSEGREKQVFSKSARLRFQERAAELLTSTPEIIENMFKIKNHYLREIVINNLRKNAESDPPDLAAKEVIDKFDKYRKMVQYEGEEFPELESTTQKFYKYRLGYSKSTETFEQGKARYERDKAAFDEARSNLEILKKQPEQILTRKPPSEEVFEKHSTPEETQRYLAISQARRKYHERMREKEKARGDSFISYLTNNYLKMNGNG